MRAMAEKDWMEDIMFLCRLSGSTMKRDTAISSNTRKLPVTFRAQYDATMSFKNLLYRPDFTCNTLIKEDKNKQRTWHVPLWQKQIWKSHDLKPVNPRAERRNLSPNQQWQHRRQYRCPTSTQSYCRDRESRQTQVQWSASYIQNVSILKHLQQLLAANKITIHLQYSIGNVCCK